jgi:hypothetical protein
MSPKNEPEVTAQTLITLRNEPEALSVITATLRVREMGPADHIRTKHEVKAWLETDGTVKEAEAIVTRARARRDIWQTQSIAQNMAERQQRGQRINGD